MNCRRGVFLIRSPPKGSISLLSTGTSRNIQVLEPYYDATEPGFVKLRTQTKESLQKEEDSAEILQLVGKSTIGGNEKIALEAARV
jgi:V-type H+-transporting ATPase subunit A